MWENYFLKEMSEYVCVLWNARVEFGNGFEVVWTEKRNWVSANFSRIRFY